MTKKDLDAVLRVLSPVIKKLVATNRSLEARIVGLEERQYKGVWDSQSQYAPGSSVTWDGSQFVALTASIGVRPGRGGPWQLAVKKGSDGKDLR